MVNENGRETSNEIHDSGNGVFGAENYSAPLANGSIHGC